MVAGPVRRHSGLDDSDLASRVQYRIGMTSRSMRVIVCSLAASIASSAPTIAATGQEHELSQRAVKIGRPFAFPVTNPMVVTWIVAVDLIVVAQAASRNMKPVPEGLQNFVEWRIESLYGFREGIMLDEGEKPPDGDREPLSPALRCHASRPSCATTGLHKTTTERGPA
jgi:hypothetical protein